MPAKGAASKVKKVVLAYSGGLDTSIILKWLQETYGCEVVTFTADLGQGEELEPARRKAELLGIKKENIFVEDLREEFVRDYVFPMFRANAVYEGVYLLGTSIARPLIAKKQIEIARQTGADAVCHGATGKGNDQVRFELTYYALEPSIKIIAPWREWAFKSREQLIEFAEKHQIPVAKDKRGEAPFSVDANLSALLLRGQGAGGPRHRAAALCLPAHHLADGRRPTTRPRSPSASPRAMPSASTARSCRRPTLLARLNDARPRQRHRPRRSGGEPLRRHEVARRLRDAGRHHPARRAPRHGIDHARPRRRAPQGRADAALRRADLQRLLVCARARDAAGG